MAGGSDCIMPLHLSLLERVLARLNLLPVPLFDIPLAPGIARVLVVSCELGVFDALNERPLTLEALAERLHSNPPGLPFFFQLLVFTRYLRQRSGPFLQNPPGQTMARVTG